MKNLIYTTIFLLHLSALTFAQNDQAGQGLKTGERIAERLEAENTEDDRQKYLIEELAAAARKAGKDNPNNPEGVKEAVRKKMDEIRDREHETKTKGHRHIKINDDSKDDIAEVPGGAAGKDTSAVPKAVHRWIKDLKAKMMDKDYVELPANDGTAALSIRATGTGQTTGHIADLIVTNHSKVPANFTAGPYFIPEVEDSGGKKQSYVAPQGTAVQIPSGATVTVPINGYCTDNTTPPRGPGEALPAYSNWYAPPQTGANGELWKPDMSTYVGLGDKPASPGITPGGGNILIPGTDIPLGVTIDIDKRPELAGPLLIHVARLVESAFDSLKAAGVVTTPFGKNLPKERMSVIQQVIWKYTGDLTGKNYSKDDFAGKTIEQYETSTGKTFAKTDDDTKTQINAGVDQFWETFQAVGVAAKILPKDHTTEVPIQAQGAAAPKKPECNCGEVSFDIVATPVTPEVKGKRPKPEQRHTADAESAGVKSTPNEKGKYEKEKKDIGVVIKSGQKVLITLENVRIGCPCTDGGECDKYQTNPPVKVDNNTKESKTINNDYKTAVENLDLYYKWRAAKKALEANPNDKDAKNNLSDARRKLDGALRKIDKDLIKKIDTDDESVRDKLEADIITTKEVIKAHGLDKPNISVDGTASAVAWTKDSGEISGLFETDKAGKLTATIKLEFTCESLSCGNKAVKCVQETTIYIPKK